MKKRFALLMAAIVLFSTAGCTPNDISSSDSSPVEGEKIAYVMQMASSDIFQMWADAAQQPQRILVWNLTPFSATVPMPNGRKQSHNALLTAVMVCCLAMRPGLRLFFSHRSAAAVS